MISVSLQKFPVDFVGFTFVRIFQLASLQIIFLSVSFQSRLYDVTEIGRFLPDPGDPVFNCVVGREYLRNGVKLLTRTSFQMGQWDRCKLLRLIVPLVDGRMKFLFPYLIQKQRKLPIQMRHQIIRKL